MKSEKRVRIMKTEFDSNEWRVSLNNSVWVLSNHSIWWKKVLKNLDIRYFKKTCFPRQIHNKYWFSFYLRSSPKFGSQSGRKVCQSDKNDTCWKTAFRFISDNSFWKICWTRCDDRFIYEKIIFPLTRRFPDYWRNVRSSGYDAPSRSITFRIIVTIFVSHSSKVCKFLLVS